MADQDDPGAIVGHKTLRDEGTGELYHEPLTRAEADAIMARVDAAKAAREAKFPTTEDAVRGLWDAWYRLKELGWRDTQYAPADDRPKQTISIGSTGIHQARCQSRTEAGREHEKWWWHDDGHDTWPHKPLFYMPDAQEAEEDRVRMEAARERFARLRSEQNTVGGENG